MTVDINKPYSALSDEQISSFRKNGFIRLKDVFNEEEIRHYGDEITRLTIDLNTQKLPLEERSTYDKAFLQVTNLWEQSDVAKEFVLGKRLAGIAAALLEVDGVRLYHDQSLYKEPGGGITPAHADQYYWPLSSDRTVTAWCPLQAVPEHMGPLGFYAGSQHVEHGRGLGISDESEREIAKTMEEGKFPYVTGAFDLGEVSFHLGWTFHRAAANRADKPRSVMTVIYMDRDKKLKETTESTQLDAATFCPGVKPGETINSPKNPVLFERVSA
ncbi:hypothetical protein DL546_009412 [Coniochaeta pulveracea]|uniref:Phytanoyl-CoA dioxygenase n=1 Tax=Coniochaeta pulveracea TaxID=177199 RepID=A0A420YJJ3_9PEZI|nr:hypothetical protein DL546_009412 [Coniochaeta pulveracea]